MKVQLTYEDLVAIVRQHFQFPKAVEIEIVPTDGEGLPPIETEVSAVRALRLAIKAMIQKFPHWDNHQKIPAIKLVRELLGYSLAECKFIVENPHGAVKNLRELKRILQ